MMNTVKKAFIVVTLLLLTLVLAQAQDKVQVPDDYAGAVRFEYADASYKDGILTFTGLGENASWLRVSPTTKLGIYETPSFIADWQYENNNIELLLKIDKGFVRLNVTVDSYDSLQGELRLTTEIVEVVSTAKFKDNKQALENLTAGELVIPINSDFVTSVYTGYNNRISSTRDSGSTGCAPDC